MNRRDHRNGLDDRSGYDRCPDAEVSLAADCRLAAVVAVDFRPAVDFHPEEGSSPVEDHPREDSCSGRRAHIYCCRHAGSRTVHSRCCGREQCLRLPVRGSYLIGLFFVRAAAAILPAAGCGDQNRPANSCRWCFGSLSIHRPAAFLSRQSAGQDRAESACMDWVFLDQLLEWREPRGGDPVQRTCQTVGNACERVPPFTWP